MKEHLEALNESAHKSFWLSLKRNLNPFKQKGKGEKKSWSSFYFGLFFPLSCSYTMY